MPSWNTTSLYPPFNFRHFKLKKWDVILLHKVSLSSNIITTRTKGLNFIQFDVQFEPCKCLHPATLNYFSNKRQQSCRLAIMKTKEYDKFISATTTIEEHHLCITEKCNHRVRSSKTSKFWMVTMTEWCMVLPKPSGPFNIYNVAISTFLLVIDCT